MLKDHLFAATVFEKSFAFSFVLQYFCPFLISTIPYLFDEQIKNRESLVQNYISILPLAFPLSFFYCILICCACIIHCGTFGMTARVCCRNVLIIIFCLFYTWIITLVIRWSCIVLRSEYLLIHFMNVVFPQLEQIFNHTHAADILKKTTSNNNSIFFTSKANRRRNFTVW